MAQPRLVERAKLFFFRNFERIFVLLLVFAIVGIHALVEQKFAFLSFYYLPMILAGFYGGRRFAVMAGVFVVALVFYYQYFQGLDMLPGFYPDALLALGPWAGFLILTGYVVGGLAEQREARLAEVKNAYMATLELLTYHIESAERNQQGHSNRVAEVAGAIGRELKLTEGDVENLQMATPVRPAFPKWTALEEVEKGAGKTFAKDAVRALRSVAARPEAAAPEAGLRV